MRALKFIESIVLGWYYYLSGNKETRALANDRMKICDLCQHKDKTLNICKSCKCFLPAKTRVKDAQCPFDYWY